MDKNFYITNRQQLLENIKDNSLIILFSGKMIHRSADSFYDFVVNRNFYYLTGIEQDNVVLVISKKQGNIEERLFIEKADPVLEKWVGKKLTKEEASDISGVDKILWVDNFDNTLNGLIGMVCPHPYKQIYFDIDRFNWDDEDHLGAKYAKLINQKYPHIKIKNVNNDLCQMRLIKKNEEVKIIEKAIDITKLGIENIMKNAKAGLKEFQIEAFFDFAIKYEGARNFAFDTIAASGKNATVLHYINNNDTTKDGDLILLDLGADLGHYCSDITRTIPVNGKFTERQREIYNVVLDAQLQVIDNMTPGKSMKEINELTKDLLTEGCKKLGLISEKEELSKYYYHSIGHPLGLDTHDVGGRDNILTPGMIYTVEPGLYIEEEGIGIRIEDDVLITENGNEVLSKDIIKTVEDIETFMAK